MRLDSGATSFQATVAGQLWGKRGCGGTFSSLPVRKVGGRAGEERPSFLVNCSSGTSFGSHPDKHPVMASSLCFQTRTICLVISVSGVH